MTANANNLHFADSPFPLDFHLYDTVDGGQAFLLRETAKPQQFELGVTNRSGKELKLDTDFFVELRFRPRTLKDADNVSLNPPSQAWKLQPLTADEKKELDGIDILRFVRTATRTIQPRELERIQLANLKADPADGTRGTQIEVRYGKLTSSVGTLKGGHRLLHTSIVNETRAAYELEKALEHGPLLQKGPIFAGFIGTNKVVNGKDTTLTLRIANLSGKPVKSGPDTKIAIVPAPATGSNPWGLVGANSNDFSSVEKTKSPNLKWNYAGGTRTAQPEKPDEESETLPEWPPSTNLDIDLTIKTAACDGPAKLFVYLNDFPEFEGNQEIVLFIEKGPITFTDGNVGIGTDKPKSKLSVSGGLAIGKAYAKDHASPDNGLLVEGNVGIGTPTPGAKLHVKGGTRVLVENAGEVRIDYRDTSNDQNWQAGTNNYGWFIYDATKSQYDLVVQKETGNVGIGTTNPGSYRLEVDGYTLLGAGIAHSHFPHTDNRAYVSGKEIIFRKDSDGNHTEQVRIDENGNVGIGTPSPDAKLHVQGSGGSMLVRDNGEVVITNPKDATGKSAFRITSPGGDPGIAVTPPAGGTPHAITFQDSGIGINPRGGKTELWVGDNGNVGIGTGSEVSDKLHVNGSVKCEGPLTVTDGLTVGGGTPLKKIIAGTVNDDGTIRAGTGYTIKKGNKGVYYVDFPANFFSKPPVAVATVEGSDDSDRDNIISVQNTTVRRLTIRTRDIGFGSTSPEVSSFSFIAIEV